VPSENVNVGEQRPGGRAARVRSAVLQAAFELLKENSYDGFGIEDVAERAGVHKTTIYRRWPTKALLMTDAARNHSDSRVPIPDTGALKKDLQTFARSIASNIGSGDGAHAAKSTIISAFQSEDLAKEMHTFWAERFAASAVIVERAVARGELPATSDPQLIIETLIGPLWVRLMLTGEPIDDDLADRVAALLVGA